ncbi:MFS transporter [Pseudomonas monteilii]|uniref:MFS transporter n=1 Tax=Pseudomonas monteilii TaxID=76759 RepID=UPI0018A9A639|nr:MFS transporter [Pseudomonas monteilii]MBF8746981.1 MFS transporter [Pseudomonas monteilii]
MRTQVQDSKILSTPLCHSEVQRKVAWRILPFLFIAYVLCNIDRSNVAIAHLELSADIGLSAAQYGLGASLFFIGYILFEVPSNMMLERFGARFTLTRIMVLWGLVTAGFMFIHSPTSFYIGRILLGIAEAGFLPGMILYLSYWFPASRRARITSLFTLGIPVAGMIGSPLSSFLMVYFDGWHGLSGWKWMFLIEGGITVALGLLTLFILEDKPATSRKLSSEEKSIIEQSLEAPGEAGKPAEKPKGFWAALLSPMILSLGFVYFSIVMSMVVLNYWAPSFIKESTGASTQNIGALSALLYGAGALGMLILGYVSDRFMLRHRFVAVALLGAAISYSLIALQLFTTPVSAFVLLSVAAFFTYGSMPVFWSIPSSALGKASAAIGIAAISALANVAGMIGPVVIGWSKSLTGHFSGGVVLLAVFLVLGALVIAFSAKHHRA